MSAGIIKTRSVRRRPGEDAPSRDRVLDSAIEEFAAYGYAGARIDRIAKRVALNVRMIYYHFGSKEGLYRGVLQTICFESAAVLGRMARASDSRATVRDALGVYFDFLAGHPEFADILVREVLDGATEMRKLLEEDPRLSEIIHQPAFRLADAAIRSGAVRAMPARETLLGVILTALVIVGTRNVHELFLGRKPPLDEWKGIFTDLLTSGLTPASPTPPAPGRRRATTAPIPTAS